MARWLTIVRICQEAGQPVDGVIAIITIKGQKKCPIVLIDFDCKVMKPYFCNPEFWGTIYQMVVYQNFRGVA
jgi:hypothetical protein